MNRQTNDDPASGGVAMGEPDATLRLIARLPAPGGLEDRVKAELHRTPVSRSAGLLDWPLAGRRSWLGSKWMQGAAAAAIVVVVAGGCWGVYSRVQPRQAQIAIPHVGVSSGFSSANAMRTPKSLDVPVVTQAASSEKGAAKKRDEAKKKTAAEHPSALQPAAR